MVFSWLPYVSTECIEVSRWGELNSRPTAYHAVALPLCYIGTKFNCLNFVGHFKGFGRGARLSLRLCVERDSNPRSPKAPDLQSGAIVRSAIHAALLNDIINPLLFQLIV